jgi:Sulfotransferase family
MPEPPPVLVHVGYHKTGSSWLQKHFFSRPETGFHYVDKAEDDHPVRQLVRVRPFEFDPHAFRARFEPLLRPGQADGLVPVVSFERLAGHPCSGGYDSKEIANRLAEVFPRARILVVIREQHSMIVSAYKQYVDGGGTCSLRQFLEPPTSPTMRVPGFDFAHFEYDHLLRYYHDLFGPESVLVLAFEQFVLEPAAFVTAIARFAERSVPAGVVDSLPFETRQRPALPATIVSIRRRSNRFVRSDLNPAPLFEPGKPKRLERFAKSRMVGALVTERRAARSEAALRRAVAEIVGARYAESNRATAALTGLDLRHYGWTI